MTAHVFAAAALIAGLIGSPDARPQVATGASGHWEGAIKLPAQELMIEVDLAPAGERWEGTISIPVQGLKGFPLSNVTVKGDTVTFAMKGVPGDPQFTGTVAKDGKSLSGDFSQGGGSLPFALSRTGDAKFERPPKSTAISKDLEGSWEGPLTISGTTLRLALRLTNQPGGSATGTLVSVDQGGVEIPIAAVVQSGTHLKLLLTAIQGNYEGEIKDGQLTGTWTQGPITAPLVFTRPK
jgi:hypothetical protein